MSSAGLVRWAGFLIAAVGMAVGVACGGDEPGGRDTPAPDGTTATISATSTATATATAAPSPTPSLPACPDPDASVCAFAAKVEADLLAGDGTRLAQGAIEREIVCNPQDEFLAQVCRGQPAGTRVRGIDIGRTYSEGSTIDRAAFATYLGSLRDKAVLAAKDDYGPGALRLYSIGERPGGSRVLVFSKIEASTPERLFRGAQLIYVDKLEGAWAIKSVVEGVQIGQDIPKKLLGGVHESITYRVWNSKDGTIPVGKGPIWFGAVVKVAAGGDCLNMRATASKTASAVECVKDGTQLQVVSGPGQADGLKWWRVVKSFPAPTSEGWVAAEFLSAPQ